MPAQMTDGVSDIGRALETEQIEHRVANGRQVLGRIGQTDLTEIFAQGDIADPMHAIFNPPMPAPQRLQTLGIGLDRSLVGEGILPFTRRFATALAADELDLAMDPADLLDCVATPNRE